MNAWEESSNYQVDEINTELEYEIVEGILRQQSVLKFASNNIQAIMACIKTLPTKANETVITQGEIGNDYYIISKGKCQVVQTKDQTHKPHVIAELNEGDSFGEEALIAESTRNASVVMKEDGLLLKLNRQDFIQFLTPSLINYVGINQCEQLIKDHAQWIDIRTPNEHETDGLGLNIPLASVRIHAHDLNKDISYIVYCNDGKKSAVAAFILKQLGINTFVLDGGLNKHLHTSSRSLLPLKANNLHYIHQQTNSPENANTQAHEKNDLHHYQDLLIDLTLKNQKEIRKLKSLHNDEIERMQACLNDAKNKITPIVTNKEHQKRIASLENNLEKRKEQVKELTNKVNSFDVKALSHQAIVSAYNDFVSEQTNITRDHQKREEALNNRLLAQDIALKQLEQQLKEKDELIAGLEYELLNR